MAAAWRRFISRAAQVSAAVRSRARRVIASCQVSSLVLPEELFIVIGKK
jgi:hypothetical protein